MPDGSTRWFAFGVGVVCLVLVVGIGAERSLESARRNAKAAK